MMKKLAIVMLALFCSTSAFAQFNTNYAKSRHSADVGSFRAGLRIGTTSMQAVGELQYSDKCHAEVRFGFLYLEDIYRPVFDFMDNGRIGGSCVDFTALNYWRCLEWDWTPRTGRWYLDAGAGVNIGGRSNFVYLGAAGAAKMSFHFNDYPLRLSLDWTPVFGPKIAYGLNKFEGAHNNSYADFYAKGLYNFGITATYCF